VVIPGSEAGSGKKSFKVMVYDEAAVKGSRATHNPRDNSPPPRPASLTAPSDDAPIRVSRFDKENKAPNRRAGSTGANRPRNGAPTGARGAAEARGKAASRTEQVLPHSAA